MSPQLAKINSPSHELELEKAASVIMTPVSKSRMIEQLFNLGVGSGDVLLPRSRDIVGVVTERLRAEETVFLH